MTGFMYEGKILHKGFPPIADENAAVLILGTLPGPASLARGEYYGHPRNAFWEIMRAVCGFPADAPYALRCEALRLHRLALWDVLFAAEREGSQDSEIRSAVPNDFGPLLRRCPAIRLVVFNGGGAEALFRRSNRRLYDTLRHVRAPSTSPAYTRPFGEKCADWRRIIGDALEGNDASSDA